MKKVICIGELLIDFVATENAPNLVSVKVFRKIAGGAPANVAAAVSRLGGKSVFMGSVGNDPFGEFLLETLKSESIDVSFCQRTKVFTTLAFVSLSEEGERDFIFNRGADKELRYDPGLLAGNGQETVHFGSATALMPGVLKETYQKYLEEASNKGSFISFDPNFREDLWKGRQGKFVENCLPFIEKAHFIKFSEEEAYLLSGKSDIRRACDYFHGMSEAVVAITLGANGTYISAASFNDVIPSIEVNVIDTTGAGDAFVGNMLFQLSKEEDPRTAIQQTGKILYMVRNANKAGAITTTKYGAIPALPYLTQLEDI